MKVREKAKEQKQFVIDLRRHFHKYPEPSLKEVKTSQKIKEELDKLAIPYETTAATGVVATIQGKRPGKTVVLRADIDALAVQELNEIDYKSTVEGVMHACGHDGHTAMLLGAGKILNSIREDIQGTIKLFFQPAEEITAGAKKMIEDGVLEGVDGVFAIHLWSGLNVGQVSVEEGPRMASADMFTIYVKGQGGHGSAPHDGVDAVLVSSAIVMNLQSIVSRELDPLEPTVVSVGTLKAGTRHNVIASEGILEGTTRCFRPEIRNEFPKRIQRIIEHTAETYRADALLDYVYGAPVTINNPACAALAVESTLKIGAQTVHMEKLTGGEDFAEFLNRIPGAIAFVGAGNKAKGANYAHHHPKFNIDEDALEIGTALYTQYALDFLSAI